MFIALMLRPANALQRSDMFENGLCKSAGLCTKSEIPQTAVWGSFKFFLKHIGFRACRIPQTAVWGSFKFDLFICCWTCEILVSHK